MKTIFKKQLFAKHILVSEGAPCENMVELIMAFAKRLNIRITSGHELASIETFKFAAEELGQNIPKPFYIGFPESVKGLSKDELLFDQLYSYLKTYGLEDFSSATHSIFEEEFARAAFWEVTTAKDFIVVNESVAKVKLKEMVENLLLSSRPLNEVQYNLVKEYIGTYKYKVEKCKCKETLIKLLLDTGDLHYMRLLHLSDVLVILQHILYNHYRSFKLKKLNLRNRDRKFLSNMIDVALEGRFSIKDCYEKRADWCGLLHHIHYKPKSEKAVDFVNKMRGGENQSAFSKFEKHMQGDVKDAVDCLLNEKGAAAVIRKLNYLISRCKDSQDVDYIMSKIKTTNNLIILQNLLQYKQYKVKPRTFKFTRFNKLKAHTETKKEFERRKSIIDEKYIDRICTLLKENLEENLKGKLGKVYIDDGMEKIALPIQETASMGGFGVLPKGSKLDIPYGKKVRLFIYWERVNDIDLSIMGLTEKLKSMEFSWRTMASNQSDALTFSGDITSGYYGGSEYFDIDIDGFQNLFPKIRYLIPCANVYSGTPFANCKCKAGYMERDVMDSGEIFEPTTVQTSFAITVNSTFAYLFAIDLQTRELIWLNIGRDSNSIIAAANGFDFLIDYFNMCDIINLNSFFAMMADEVVDNIEDADVVVSDKVEDTFNGDKQVIRSYDLDKLLAFLND